MRSAIRSYASVCDRQKNTTSLHKVAGKLSEPAIKPNVNVIHGQRMLPDTLAVIYTVSNMHIPIQRHRVDYSFSYSLWLRVVARAFTPLWQKAAFLETVWIGQSCAGIWKRLCVLTEHNTVKWSRRNQRLTMAHDDWISSINQICFDRSSYEIDTLEREKIVPLHNNINEYHTQMCGKNHGVTATDCCNITINNSKFRRNSHMGV